MVFACIYRPADNQQVSGGSSLQHNGCTPEAGQRGEAMFLLCKYVRKLAVAAAILSAPLGAHATAIIDPALGASGFTNWMSSVGTGFFVPVVTFLDASGNSATIDVTTDSTINFSIADGGIPGDAFALQLDGATLTPTSGNLGPDTRGPSATSFFSASFDNIFLSSGSHTFGLFVTDACCNGGGTYSAVFSAATPVSSVPEPATVALIGLGLVGVGWSRRQGKRGA
jgi:hypothetical protein